MLDTDLTKNEVEDIEEVKNLDKKLKEYTKKMKDAAQNLEFEEAMTYRDKIKKLELLAIKNL